MVPGLGWMVLCLQEFDGENGGVFPGVSVTSQMKGKGMSLVKHREYNTLAKYISTGRCTK